MQLTLDTSTAEIKETTECVHIIFMKSSSSFSYVYIEAHVLLILLNKLGKRGKMRGLPSIFSLFRNEYNKFNNTRARMLESINHMTLRLL